MPARARGARTNGPPGVRFSKQQTGRGSGTSIVSSSRPNERIFHRSKIVATTYMYLFEDSITLSRDGLDLNIND